MPSAAAVVTTMLVFSVQDIHLIMKVDLFLNSFYQLGTYLWEQCTGVAIGGPMSAQNADAYLMAIESTIPWGQFIPSHVKLRRFRDNIFCICPLHPIPYWMSKVKHDLSILHRLDLSVSQCNTQAEVCVSWKFRWSAKGKILSGA